MRNPEARAETEPTLMRMKSIALLALALNACAPNYVIWNKTDFPSSRVHATLSGFEIHDSRDSVREIGFKNKDWFGKYSFSKALSEKDKESIRNEVARNFADGESRLRFSVKIIKATVEFENTGLRERWRGHFQIRMDISGSNGNSYCKGEASLMRAGGLFIKVKPVLEKLFEEGMILTTYKCIEAWKGEVESESQGKSRT